MSIEPRTVAERCHNVFGRNLVSDLPGKIRWVAKICVWIITLKEHQFVIAAQPDYLCGCSECLALKRPEEPDTLARIRPRSITSPT